MLATLGFSLNYFSLAVRIEEVAIEHKFAKDTLRGWYDQQDNSQQLMQKFRLNSFLRIRICGSLFCEKTMAGSDVTTKNSRESSH